jgi:hypothetical protein
VYDIQRIDSTDVRDTLSPNTVTDIPKSPRISRPRTNTTTQSLFNPILDEELQNIVATAKAIQKQNTVAKATFKVHFYRVPSSKRLADSYYNIDPQIKVTVGNAILFYIGTIICTKLGILNMCVD